MHICIVLASDLFRLLSGNQWIRSNIYERRSSKDCYKLIEKLLSMYTVQYHRYVCTEINVECSIYPSTVAMVNEIFNWMQMLCIACVLSAV